MLRLVGSNKLQVVLSGAATASRVTVSYMDFTATGVPTGDTTLTATNGATPVDICAAPAASTTRQVDHISLVALAAMTATFSVNDGTARDLFKAILASGDVFDWSHSGGAKVLDSAGAVKYALGGNVSATTLSVSGDSTLTGDLAVNGGDLTTTATTFNLLAANATTVNAFGAASVALNIGHASAAAAFAGGISIPTGKSVTGTGSATVTGFASVSATSLQANTASSTYALEIGSTGADVRARIQGNTAYGLVLSNTGASGVWLGSSSADTLQISKGDGTSLGTWGTAVTIPGTLGVTGAITGTLATAAQPNITSVGTLTSVTSSGAISGTTLAETTGAAWTTYTPTIAADTGTWGALTVTAASYRKLGKTLFLMLNVNATVASGSPAAGKISLPGGITSGTSGLFSPAFLNVAGTDLSGWINIVAGGSTVDFYQLGSTVYTGTVYFRVNVIMETS